jgi:maltooligosyltrehalose trehalohydrolase
MSQVTDTSSYPHSKRGLSATTASRKYAAGAEFMHGGVHFRVWAPEHQRAFVVIESTGKRQELIAEEGGYFSAFVEGVSANDRYRYQLNDDPRLLPDPASRFQPEGVHGPSQVIDPSTFAWTDKAWQGVNLPGQILYELHVGCFTPEGTWRAAIAKLPHLVATGITVIEVMPVNEFNGNFGWGYDGVYWYAPTRLYGNPDDFREFVNAAHKAGLAVILDVVYNHFGPSGNYAPAFSPHYFSKRHPTEWGDAINYDSEGAGGVRDFVIQNAAYWIDEFHLDGLRLDATHSILDDSRRHILADLNDSARRAADGRAIIIIAENESQDVLHVEPTGNSGYGLDGLWNDDFHHTCRVAATGHAEYYYADYAGTPNELLSATRWGYLYQGQYTPHSKRWRGTPAWHLPAWRFVSFLQNHDQVANSAHGLRLPQLTSPGRYRALTTLWLLGPATPMFFMGQEFATTSPFLYFADHEVDIAKLVREGRWEALRRFPRIAGREGATVRLADPSEEPTFIRSKVDWDALEQNQADWILHRDLIQLRKSDSTFSRQDSEMLQGAVIGAESFLLRWLPHGQGDRLLIVNLGRDARWLPAAEPLIAAPAGTQWRLKFSSDDELYGGSGTAMLNTEQWYLPGHAAILLTPVDASRE